MPPVKKLSLATGDHVVEKKKDGRPGVILRSHQDNKQPHQWVIEFVNPDGSKSEEVKGSRAVKRPPAATTNDGPVVKPHLMEPPKPQPQPQPQPGSDEDSQDDDSDDDDENILALKARKLKAKKGRSRRSLAASNTAADDASSDEKSVSTTVREGDDDDDDLETQTPPAPSPPSGDSDAMDTEDPDAMETEDLEEGEEDMIETEEEFLTLQEEYLLEKAKLVADEHAIEKETSKPGLSVGAKVHTRGVDQRVGYIFGKSDCGKKWLVVFNDDPEDMHELSSQSLVQIFEPEVYSWKLVEHSDPEDQVEREYGDIGLTYFDFNQFQPERLKKGNPGYSYPHLALLQKLWPGNWKHQLTQMNQHIDATNEDAKKKNKKARNIRKVTMREWWIFIGILIAAAAHRLGGAQLFEKERDFFTATEPINYGIDGLDIMPEYRFKDIKSVFPHAFQDKKAEEDGDPWFMVRGMINGFNFVRSMWVAASIKKVLDESMCAWRPQTTKTGGLPHISRIPRKPEDLGTEFKSVACGVTGIVLYLEIQEGKKAMAKKKYSDRFGGTFACTFRLIEETLYSGQKWRSRKEAKEAEKPEHFVGDSWFSSVLVAEWMAQRGHSYVGAVKTSTRLFPREELIKEMKAFPSGSSLVFECVTPNGHTLLAIGYKYNKRKVLTFVATKNAGSTRPGNPYMAKFNDGVGNVCTRAVERPAVLSDYFEVSNAIDMHNHVRQGELKLEKRWLTFNCWFRLNTTLLGMTIADCWKAFKHHVADPKQKEISIIEFADRMASDCIRNKFDDTFASEANLNLTAEAADAPLATVDVHMDDVSVVSAVTVASTLDDLRKEHPKMNNPELQTSGRPRRRTCRVEGCTTATQFMCSNDTCRSFKYNCNGKSVRGMFYCKEHWPQEHWKDLGFGAGSS